ncbi:MAG: MFS transporter [Prosthecobacter sp.]|uniref:MFS transporter n=1 Tax=Prosthecobacter sp. TaxID=1965333 RepID=UPI0025CF583C|nr:MFS transporter [Prosthecobacter sp.]MCF7787856.1 MFS transporter [Prosthecobacter sp.]
MKSASSTRLLLIIAYLGFISLGLPDTLIGVAWPSVRDGFGRQQGDLAWIFFGTGASYFLSGMVTGRLLNRYGIGLLLAGSSLLVAVSGFGYGTASLWILFASCSLLHGLGSGAIDTGLNHYVAHHFSARHMNWLHACYSIGATLGPLIMTTMLVSLNSWRAGYLTVATLLLLLTLLFAFTRRNWDASPKAGTEPEVKEATAALNTLDALRSGVVWMQIALFFIYTGLEVTVGQWSFTLLTESRSIGKETAGLWVTLYWASITTGRILFGFVVDRLGIDRLLRLSMLGVVTGLILFALNGPAMLSAFSLSLTGLGLASIFPCLMTRTPQRMGKARAAHAIGFQVSAAMIGAAVFPSACGWLVQRSGLELVASMALIMGITMLILHEMLLRWDARSARSTL